MNSSGTLKIARNGYIVMAVIFCALGIFLMVNPTKAMKIICVLAGILFIADGIIKIIGYFSRDFYCLAFQFDLGFGILMIAIGILILVRRESILRLIFVIFASGFSLSSSNNVLIITSFVKLDIFSPVANSLSYYHRLCHKPFKKASATAIEIFQKLCCICFWFPLHS